MKRWVNRKIRLIWFLYWVCHVQWRAVRGRCFIFREAPRLIVKIYCMTTRHSKDLQEERAMAVEEWRLRKRKRHEPGQS